MDVREVIELSSVSIILVTNLLQLYQAKKTSTQIDVERRKFSEAVLQIIEMLRKLV